MNSIYHNICVSLKQGEKLLTVLIDPDKAHIDSLPGFMKKLHASRVTHIFVGGSEVPLKMTDVLVVALKELTNLPIVLFPGDVSQISENADALLFLSLISGRNPDYLIGKHVEAASRLKNSKLEIISTGYMLIENGKETAVQRVTATQPIKKDAVKHAVETALAGQLLGQKLMYLEAGSGAIAPVGLEMIFEVKSSLNIPLIVGGGIRTKKQIHDAYNAGADMIVIGTAFEEDDTFFNELI